MSPHNKASTIDLGVVLAAGRDLELRQAIPVPSFESFSFPDPAEVAREARRVGRGVALIGTIDITAVGLCARCLEDVRVPLHIDVEEALTPAGERADPLDENLVLVGNVLDLGDLTRQLIDSALPMTTVCAVSCGGLCPTCGNKRDDACLCPLTLADPE